MAKKIMTPPTSTINCTYHGKIEKHCKNGARELWNARHPDYPGVCGAGNTAHNAIRDWRVQVKHYLANKVERECRNADPTKCGSAPSTEEIRRVRPDYKRSEIKNTTKLAHVLPEVFGDPGDSVGFQSRMV